MQPTSSSQTAKPRVAMLTIFDVAAIGARSIHAGLVASKYPTDLILFRDKRDREGTLPSQQEYSLLAGLFAEQKPDVLGISFRSFALDIAMRITQIARESGIALIVWGGTHPTLLPEECIKTADVVCIGEGEEPMLELMQALEAGNPISSIQNLWVRQQDRISKNPLRPLIQDLDSLHFPVLGNQGKFTIENGVLKPEDIYLGGNRAVSYFIAGSRGCPFNCDFCCNSAFRETFKGLGKYVRKRSPENVMQELDIAKDRLDVRFVGFMDEVFSLDPEWTESICSLYGQKIDIPFKCEVHPNTCSEELVRVMKNAGLSLAVLGVQSGSERSRRENYSRRTKDSDILAAARSLHSHGILTYYDFILDNPYETREDLARTLELMLSLPRPHNFEIFSLSYFPGTRITERALKDGKISRDQVEDRSQKTYADFWSEAGKSLDQDNALLSALAWLSLVKYHPARMELIFFSEKHGDSFHVIPKGLIRHISGFGFLKTHPQLLYKLTLTGMRWSNRLLLPLRLMRTTLGMIRSRSWKEIAARAKARFLPARFLTGD